MFEKSGIHFLTHCKAQRNCWRCDPVTGGAILNKHSNLRGSYLIPSDVIERSNQRVFVANKSHLSGCSFKLCLAQKEKRILIFSKCSSRLDDFTNISSIHNSNLESSITRMWVPTSCALKYWSWHVKNGLWRRHSQASETIGTPESRVQRQFPVHLWQIKGQEIFWPRQPGQFILQVMHRILVLSSVLVDWPQVHGESETRRFRLRNYQRSWGPWGGSNLVFHAT